jgi:hypothetical protein
MTAQAVPGKAKHGLNGNWRRPQLLGARKADGLKKASGSHWGRCWYISNIPLPASIPTSGNRYSAPGRRHSRHVQHVRRRRHSPRSVFALNIMPYISASIIIQLLTTVSRSGAEGRQTGRKTLNQYTRYLTVLLAAFQSMASQWDSKAPAMSSAACSSGSRPRSR